MDKLKELDENSLKHDDAETITDKIVRFVNSIGIGVTDGPVTTTKEVLPGICIENGAIVIDRERLKYPGDILHEAAHLAVARPEKRVAMDGLLHSDEDEDKGEELMSIAWSYAVALHLKIDPILVFHSGGYNGGGEYIVDNFSQGRFFGVSMLQWIGLTYEPGKAAGKKVAAFPHMLKWVRE